MINCFTRSKEGRNAPNGLGHFYRTPRLFLVLLLMLSALVPWAQNRTVTGRVTAADGTTPLSGVSVQVKGGATGTQTNEAGNYTLQVPANATLVFSYVGNETQEVAVGNRSAVNFQFKSTNQEMQQVVVVGYGRQKKATVTGSVAAVQGTELDKSPTVNLSNSLAGRLPGITAIQGSGEPGYDGSTIRIRGTNSFGNSSPLVVIDGVPDRAGGLDRLNPADIESMSILKDAAAAIYGARAANGVILITTKQGKIGKPVVSYDYNYGLLQPTVVPEMANAAQYAELMNEQTMFQNVPFAQWGAAWPAIKQQGFYVRSDNNQRVNAIYSPQDVQKFADGSSPLTHPNTNWYNSVFKKWTNQQTHSLQVSGGTEALRVLASIGYQNQDAYYKNSATKYSQYDARINIDAKINKYINTTIGALYRQEVRDFPTVGAGDIFRMLVRGKPTEMAVWPNGLPGPDIENGQNPVVVTTGATGYDKDRRNYLQANGQMVISNPWVSGLKLTLQAAADKYMRNTKRFATPWALYTWDKTTFEADGVTPKLTRTIRSTFTDPQLNMGNEDALKLTLTGLLNYDRTFGDHTVGLLAGIQKEQNDGESFSAFRRDFISAALDQLSVGGQQRQNVGSGGFAEARLSYFGRAAYNYQEKYLAEFLWRYDGSYFFPEKDRFGFFPGVLAGWTISKEKFFEPVKFVNNLKIRGSYGQMGNDRVDLPAFGFLSTYSLSGTQVINGQLQRTLTEARVPNLNFTWEVATNANIGLEGTLFNNRVFFEADVFRNKRDQMLITNSATIPNSAGIASLPPVNEGEMVNRGWEFRLGYNGKRGRDFTYTVSVNGGYSKNEVLKWNDIASAPEYQKTVGRPVGTNGAAYLVFESDGIFVDEKDIAANKLDYTAFERELRPGDMKFKDINGDNKIDNFDQVRLDQTRDPRFTGGLSINMSYKSFDLSMLFQGATGGLQRLNFNETGEFGNWLTYGYNNRWSVDNPSSEHPRLVSRNNRYYAGSQGNNTYWLRSNRYLRFKNFELGYNLAPSIGDRLGISRLRLYVSGLNIATWDKLGIWDPEATAENGYAYPQSRIISFGARVTF
ncbi:TonB-linked outer membrane protein, SusC/RagA family [Cnuella takakiae]|uniref:TonB-linked outer membrane protein, SusC/RagA family n=2 Tax=Cnuella takakiae TaxID=1302690 RepID=A0A1M5GFW5_9BACT|nr:TonB-linked outer membrane protein, SusC/RagA family [Cnuella takakiae]